LNHFEHGELNAQNQETKSESVRVEYHQTNRSSGHSEMSKRLRMRFTKSEKKFLEAQLMRHPVWNDTFQERLALEMGFEVKSINAWYRRVLVKRIKSHEHKSDLSCCVHRTLNYDPTTSDTLKEIRRQKRTTSRPDPYQHQRQPKSPAVGGINLFQYRIN